MLRAALLLILLTVPLRGQDILPHVTEAPWPEVRARLLTLLPLLKKSAILSLDIERRLERLLDDPAPNGVDALRQVQGLLDPSCLVAIHINPESRVKAARGPADARLVMDQAKVFLIKVHNEGGITPPLTVSGEELRVPMKRDASRWLEAAIFAPEKGTLSGRRLEYVLLVLTARESGKREATLQFDAGQGTQDLGFRADVPILFRVVLP